MKSIKLNAVEMAKVNGGDATDSAINPDGSCASGICGCTSSAENRANYTQTMNNKDSAWGA